jgi:RNA polymerase sigma-70 factor (ECF subfamily)
VVVTEAEIGAESYDSLDGDVSINTDRAESLTDEDLAQVAQRDTATAEAKRAASILFGRYMGRIYVWCYRYVHEHERALDLAQDVVLSAYKGLGTYSGRARFFSWIFTITRNKCLNAMRRPPILRDEEVELDRLAGRDPGPDRLLEEKLDEQAILDLARQRLDEEEHEVLCLRCFERMPVDEITMVLDIKGASGARGVLQRARRKLRLAIEEQKSE